MFARKLAFLGLVLLASGSLLGSHAASRQDPPQRQEILALIRTLDEDRLSSRQLFPPELKGKTW